MSGFQSPITIGNAIEHIRRNEYLIPAFQREFVWKSYQVERLFDSLMQGYPIGSMLFWKVKDERKSKYRFYKFLENYVEYHKTHNTFFDTHSNKDFYAILDGQQRLTALYIGLFGYYAYHQYRCSWEYSEKSFPKRYLYLNISRTFPEDEDDLTYKFKFIDNKECQEKPIFQDNFGDRWFKVGYIVSLHKNTDYDLDEFSEENKLEKNEKKILRKLENVIFTDLLINYYEEDSSEDIAVNIFVRINSGGTSLSFSDILLSLMIANWKNKDAKTEIANLVDCIKSKGFSINHDFILKSMLYLFHNDVRFRIKSFDNEFVSMIEKEWESIRNAILNLFDMLRGFGFDNWTLTSYNATLPILYYIYHRNIFEHILERKDYKQDLYIIKQWLLKTIVLRTFTGSSDGKLSISRKAFTTDFVNKKIDDNILSFPASSLSKELNQGSLSDENYEEILYTQKDNKFAFSILALLYPNCDCNNNKFHLDHLHPIDSFNNEIHDWKLYNSILNLELLNANENMSKSNTSLKDWVDKEIKSKNIDRATFLANHLIPNNVSLELKDFNEFIEARKKLLIEQFHSIMKL